LVADAADARPIGRLSSAGVLIAIAASRRLSNDWGRSLRLLEPGQLIRGTYEIERLIGEGAFAEVYRVRHRFMGRQAMKVFKARNASLAEIEADIEEALLLSGMRHPNIVEVYDANVLEAASGRHGYFTMTYMPGGTLERYWRGHGTNLMTVEQVVNIMRQVCRGLAVAHSATPPIVHRDIKPQNILVSYGEDNLQVRLSDFGLARAVNPMTLLVSAKGTLGFKPPETLDNLDSCCADVWAVGTTMYLLLTDQMPYPMLDDRDSQDASRFLRPLRPPSIFNVAVDSGLESILYRCLAANAGDRYPDAMSLLADLERWTPDFTPRAMSVSMSQFGDKAGGPGGDPEALRSEAEEVFARALETAKDPTLLSTAADLLEEAISKDPSLHQRYRPQLQLWRRGIMHVSTRDFEDNEG
jgi:serine/threonine protein kinase